jgi:hypothetical protein
MDQSCYVPAGNSLGLLLVFLSIFNWHVVKMVFAF